MISTSYSQRTRNEDNRIICNVCQLYTRCERFAMSICWENGSVVDNLIFNKTFMIKILPKVFVFPA
jgi:hypothetical protein